MLLLRFFSSRIHNLILITYRNVKITYEPASDDESYESDDIDEAGESNPEGTEEWYSNNAVNLWL